MSRPPRVCIFAEFLYPLLSAGRIPFAGGIEVQLALIGRGLAARGFDVRVVTCDYGQPDRVEVGGLTLLKAYPPAGGIPGVRFLHPRLSLGLSALRLADADVYMFRGAALWAGLVHAVAHARGRRFVWFTGHDHDVHSALPNVHGVRDRWFLRRAIRGADAIVTQTRSQQERLRKDFGLESTVISNSVELPPDSEVLDAGAGTDLVRLSIYKTSKRPEWFTRFAETHPDVRCRMAGVVPHASPGEREWRAARAVAARAPGLEVRGTIPHERIREFLRGAALFTHSSPAEGFPNTLLECWANGLPSVSRASIRTASSSSSASARPARITRHGPRRSRSGWPTASCGGRRAPARAPGCRRITRRPTRTTRSRTCCEDCCRGRVPGGPDPGGWPRALRHRSRRGTRNIQWSRPAHLARRCA